MQKMNLTTSPLYWNSRDLIGKVWPNFFQQLTGELHHAAHVELSSSERLCSGRKRREVVARVSRILLQPVLAQRRDVKGGQIQHLRARPRVSWRYLRPGPW